MADYETFSGEQLREGEEIDLELIDRETKEVFQARARLTKNQAELPGSSPLFVRDPAQGRTGEVWYVSILKRLDEDDLPVQKAEVPLEERHGYLLRSLIEERLGRGQDPRTHG